MEHDLFRVEIGPTDPPANEALFDAVRTLGYAPSIVDGSGFHAAVEPTPPTGEPPERIKKALEQAKTGSRKGVLVHLMGDG
ncbi:MAG: hypothetical protein HYY93_15385 [Planctomycetes bacterium]|nr:hypothetical protein [Planctomycetota bacterium]